MTREARTIPPSLRAKRSPCISVCRMAPETGLCEGCLRTIDEIAGWGSMPEAERLRIWQLLDQRREALAARSASTS